MVKFLVAFLGLFTYCAVFNGYSHAQEVEGNVVEDVIEVAKTDQAERITSEPSTPMTVGYFTNWGIYGRNFQPTDVDFLKITHINYAFFDVTSDCQVMSLDPYADYEKMYPDLGMTWWPVFTGQKGTLGAFKILYDRLRAAGVTPPKMMPSIGGWTKSVYFSKCTKDPVSRKGLVSSLVAHVKKYDFDGVDIDWEYPGGGGEPGNTSDPADPANYALFLREIREGFNAEIPGKAMLISIAEGMHPAVVGRTPIQEICSIIDYMNTMTYDYSGGWNPFTGVNAPLYPDPADKLHDPQFTIQWGINELIKRGCPAQKIVLGLPWSGRCWKEVANMATTDGLYQPANGVCEGTWEPGAVSYNDTYKKYSSANGYVYKWHAPSATSYRFNVEKKVFVSYDDQKTVQGKAAYAKSLNLAGFMFWECSDDKATNETTQVGQVTVKHYELLDAAHKGWSEGPVPPPPNNPVVLSGWSMVKLASTAAQCGHTVALSDSSLTDWCKIRCTWALLDWQVKGSSLEPQQYINAAFVQNKFDRLCDLSQVAM